METHQIVEAAGAIAALKELTPRVLGPTADYLGEGLKNWTEKGVENLVRIFRHAAESLKDQDDPSEGVPPRILNAVLNEGYFCDDELEATYLGGILASAKGPISRDDRAMSYLSVLSSLSSYQIRTHCLIYTAILNNENMSRSEMRWAMQRTRMTLTFLDSDYKAAMEFADDEDAVQIAQHCFVGLEKNGLSEGGTMIVDGSYGAPKPFRFIYPTAFGIETFVWGLGYGKLGSEAFLTPDLLKSPIGKIMRPLDIKPDRVGW
jgi:hypothetical protein